MRTDEEILTGIALGTIPCPCEEDCRSARRAASDDFKPYHRDGVGNVVSSHEAIDDLVACVSGFFARFLTAWYGYKTAEVLQSTRLTKFMQIMKDYEYGKDGEVHAFRRVVKRMRLYALESKKDLQNFGLHKMTFLADQTLVEIGKFE